MFKKLSESGGIATRHHMKHTRLCESTVLDCAHYDQESKACKIGVDDPSLQVAKGDTCPVANQPTCPAYISPANSVASEQGTSVGEGKEDSESDDDKKKKAADDAEDASDGGSDEDTECEDCGKKLNKDGKCPECNKKDEAKTYSAEEKKVASWILFKAAEMNGAKTGQIDVTNLVSLIRKEFDV